MLNKSKPWGNLFSSAVAIAIKALILTMRDERLVVTSKHPARQAIELGLTQNCPGKATQRSWGGFA